MKTLLLAVAIVAATIAPAAALAAMFEHGDAYSLPSGELVGENLYLGAGTATIAGEIHGDLLVAGGTVLVSGRVSGDVFAAGGTLTVTGSVADDVRVTGGTITVDGEIGGDLIVVGGTMNLTANSSIAGELTMIGGLVTIDGTVAGEAHLRGGEATVNGTLAGSLDATIERLTFGPRAILAGDLTYRGPREATITDGAQLRGEVTYEPRPARTSGNGVKIWGLFIVGFGLIGLKALALLVAALVLISAFPKGARHLVAVALDSPWREIVRGLVVAVVVPIGIVLLGLTIIGLPLALLLLVAYLTLIVASCIYGSVIFGAMIYRMFRKADEIHVSWQIVTIGTTVLGLITLIPLIGGLVALLTFCLTLGASAKLVGIHVWAKRK